MFFGINFQVMVGKKAMVPCEDPELTPGNERKVLPKYVSYSRKRVIEDLYVRRGHKYIKIIGTVRKTVVDHGLTPNQCTLNVYSDTSYIPAALSILCCHTEAIKTKFFTSMTKSEIQRELKAAFTSLDPYLLPIVAGEMAFFTHLNSVPDLRNQIELLDNTRLFALLQQWGELNVYSKDSPEILTYFFRVTRHPTDCAELCKILGRFLPEFVRSLVDLMEADIDRHSDEETFLKENGKHLRSVYLEFKEHVKPAMETLVKSLGCLGDALDAEQRFKETIGKKSKQVIAHAAVNKVE